VPRLPRKVQLVAVPPLHVVLSALALDVRLIFQAVLIYAQCCFL
jgi:hypothetical protein